MKTYTVPLRMYEEEEHVTRFGGLAVPDAFMGRKPIHIWYDPEEDEFFLLDVAPDSDKAYMVAYAEFIVTIWPRDEAHQRQRLQEVEDFWRGVRRDLTPEAD